MIEGEEALETAAALETYGVAHAGTGRNRGFAFEPAAIPQRRRPPPVLVRRLWQRLGLGRA